MAQTTTTNLNNLYDTIFEQALLTLREMAMMPMLVTQYSGVGYAQRKIGSLAAVTFQTKAEGVDFANPTTLEKSVAATLTPAVAMGQFMLTDEAIETDNIDDLVERARLELGQAAAEKIDKDIISNFTSFTSGVGTANAALTIANVAAAINRLRAAKVMGEVSVVLHPYQWHDIWVLLGQPLGTFAFAGEVANEALRNNFVSRALGSNWYISANIATDANDDAIGAAFVRDALAIDLRKSFTLELDRDPSKLSTEYNGSVGYATGIIRNVSGVKITSDVTLPT